MEKIHKLKTKVFTENESICCIISFSLIHYKTCNVMRLNFFFKFVKKACLNDMKMSHAQKNNLFSFYLCKTHFLIFFVN